MELYNSGKLCACGDQHSEKCSGKKLAKTLFDFPELFQAALDKAIRNFYDDERKQSIGPTDGYRSKNRKRP